MRKRVRFASRDEDGCGGLAAATRAGDFGLLAVWMERVSIRATVPPAFTVSWRLGTGWRCGRQLFADQIARGVSRAVSAISDNGLRWRGATSRSRICSLVMAEG